MVRVVWLDLLDPLVLLEPPEASAPLERVVTVERVYVPLVQIMGLFKKWN